MTAAWVGDKDLACEQLAKPIRGPSNLYLWPIETDAHSGTRFAAIRASRKSSVTLRRKPPSPDAWHNSRFTRVLRALR